VASILFDHFALARSATHLQRIGLQKNGAAAVAAASDSAKLLNQNV
jgi:hypothetical protein